MVNITLRVISKPNIQELPNIYRRLGKDFDDRVLPSVANEVLKSVVVRIFLFKEKTLIFLKFKFLLHYVNYLHYLREFVNVIYIILFLFYF